ncbi:MAG: glycosyltransferase family 2 protein [Ardenticatenaceae bacterium]|nr:glycosyltransferase family 2 protein [Ardenticatenaceae bacterium]
MYETALPEATRRRVADLNPAGVVVGIPSYRNPKTIAAIVGAVGQALHQRFAGLDPVIVNVDGHSFDETLSIATKTRTPPSVRRVATRYLGLPGKGSALRAIFEIATQLQARALLLVEADVVSFRPWWIERLLAPILARQADVLLPAYVYQQPIPFVSDVLVRPVIAGLFGIELSVPTPGEIAMAGSIAAYFADRDVWETDVARNGVDIWMIVEALAGDARVARIPLELKRHRSPRSDDLREAKFLQEVGTLFRLVYLQRRIWQQAISLQPVPLLPPEPMRSPAVEAYPREWPSAAAIWEQARALFRPLVHHQWEQALLPPHLDAVEQILASSHPRPGVFSDGLWARVVYDFITAYNKGEGDPDKVVLALYPLFLVRQATLIAEASTQTEYEAAIHKQAHAFVEKLSYFVQRWERYISPEQVALWRELGLLDSSDGL